jgi:hypothetical protein
MACGDTLSKGSCDAFRFREVEVSTGFPVSFNGRVFSRCRGFGADVKVHSTPLISQNLPVIQSQIIVSTKWVILIRRFDCNHAWRLSILACVTRPVFPASRLPRASIASFQLDLAAAFCVRYSLADRSRLRKLTMML